MKGGNELFCLMVEMCRAADDIQVRFWLVCVFSVNNTVGDSRNDRLCSCLSWHLVHTLTGDPSLITSEVEGWLVPGGI